MNPRLWFFALCFAGCQGRLGQQPREGNYTSNGWFADGSSMRPRIPGTVDRAQQPSQVQRGAEIPVRIDRALLERGHERFDIYCAACHGRAGDGQGMVVQRGFTAPPSFHSERLRAASAAHYFEVITNGFGAMYPYGDRVPLSDRWAIIAYIQALQLSRHLRYGELTLSDQAKLKEASQ